MKTHLVITKFLKKKKKEEIDQYLLETAEPRIQTTCSFQFHFLSIQTLFTFITISLLRT